MSGTGHGPDFSVLKNHAFAPALSRDGSIYHCPRQVVGWNYLVGEQPPKDGVNRTQKPVTEIRFLPRLHGIDVGGAEYVKTMEPRRQQRLLGLSFIACEGHPAASCLVGAPMPRSGMKRPRSEEHTSEL